MIETIKSKLWDILKEKKISLAMIYNREGEVLWYRGRRIRSKWVQEGEEFCKSYILKSMENGEAVDQDNVYITYSGDGLSESAERLRIKSILILPIDRDFFLYVDSGTQMTLSESERVLIRMLGNLLTEAIQKIKRSHDGIGGISGQSEAIKQVRNMALKFSLEEDCVLLLGETGVGKSYMAEIIHNYSGRKGKFIVADTTTINENLFESVIFGHKKGSFTGAIDDRRGLVNEANEGTLLFDEISEVPLSFQSKLLRFIETKKYRVLGDPAEKASDVRILAATNRDLKQLISEKKFREDLFYRLNILVLTIPPLRDRKEDIKVVVNENQRHLKGKEIGEGFWKAILNYHWPGNYRELFAVLKRAGILCESPITGKDIEKMIDKYDMVMNETKQASNIDTAWQELESGKNFWQVVKEPFMNRELNRGEVKSIITRALRQANGSYINALEFLHLDRSEYKKFMKFIHNNRFQFIRVPE
ncbi:MAG: AAA domain-containing protein [Candidatus Aminicenantes bacterium]|nr:AAA domain-containing protein [Candidatus Aminicenantes bacterium]NIM81272.1 AAA domain-containing protein [Candidatus Aminicenantes bacterium]NIN20674.1 AAA domain-containing protein [Candidatus Aminicenantes bacterium]NIN44450.1 AAA domain-containing protein [Candidatus Aminicenantes bacterium]NIN87272.1 AAA domain-containing protein [Candidatus Aminicenantes bacterium]